MVVKVILLKLAEATAVVKRTKAELEANRHQQLEQTAARAKAEGDRGAAEQQRSLHEERRQVALFLRGG